MTDRISDAKILGIVYGPGTQAEKAQRYGVGKATVHKWISRAKAGRLPIAAEDVNVAGPRRYVNGAMRETYKPTEWGR